MIIDYRIDIGDWLMEQLEPDLIPDWIFGLVVSKIEEMAKEEGLDKGSNWGVFLDNLDVDQLISDVQQDVAA